ncbi:CHASE3 domain sensor protein [Actimicrobium sp. GrIS 1.19]|uniref:MCP four helix bundle domain-containing protein n=1 Tax=Actimicrobium sp. GrIS 1.19 TaxID=3071708 RepID=UPI002E026C30|nr:CHASE3 domain sensor protein [Actimicrobium sp. GrIS 1.19]
MKFSNLNVGSRLAVGFGIVLILLIILAGVSIWRLQSVGAALNEITNQGLQK